MQHVADKTTLSTSVRRQADTFCPSYTSRYFKKSAFKVHCMSILGVTKTYIHVARAALSTKGQQEVQVVKNTSDNGFRLVLKIAGLLLRSSSGSTGKQSPCHLTVTSSEHTGTILNKYA